jgi:hypothetical protein
MVIINKVIILIILLSAIVACGKNNTVNNSPVFLTGQIKSGMPLAYVEKFGLIKNLKRHQLIFDTDGDGILDKDDPDIDGDGIPNDCDSAPFDAKIGTLDSDNDGIPDFCDINPRSDRIKDSEKAIFQKNIFLKTGIIIVEDDLNFTESDIPFLTKVIDHIAETAKLPNAKLLTIAITTKLSMGEYGSYDLNWSNIRYKRDESSMDVNIKLWQWAFTHEFFHFVAEANPEYYLDFHQRYVEEQKNGTLVYPTEYSRESESEYFAELETFHYFSIN